jgi:hypothetical protein
MIRFSIRIFESNGLQRILFSRETELPSAFANIVHGLRQRICAILNDVHRQLDQLNIRFQQLEYKVQVNLDRVVRRLGNLGSILGLAPKGMQ